MSAPQEGSLTPFPQPIEFKLVDVLFIAMRKNLILFKELGNESIHYSIFIRDSLIDVHKTIEGKQNKHIPLAEVEFDWQFLMEKIQQEVNSNWKTIFQTVKVNDPDWADLEVEFIPVEMWGELLSPLVKRHRWNVDEEFLSRLQRSLKYSRLEDFAGHGFVIGTGEGYLVMSDGIDCFLFDTDKLSKIIEKGFESSVRKVHLSYFTSRSLFGYLKIRLLILVNSALRFIRKQL